MATFIFFPLSQVIVMAAAMMIISYYGWFRDKNTGLPFLEDPTRAPMIMLCVAAVLCIISDAFCSISWCVRRRTRSCARS